MGHLRVGIIDIGIGSINSVARSLERVGATVGFVETPVQLKLFDKLVFPGVGSFSTAAEKLRQNEFGACISECIQQRQTPFLGICLGMQLLGTYGYENGGSHGLGLIPAEVGLLDAAGHGLSLPHVGWNDVTHTDNSMFLDIPQDTSFYFVHSYCMPNYIAECEVAHCKHGETFAAAVQKDWLWGTQFHPEKSQNAGLKLLKNFIEY
jgi:glutamine amidotransferase